jgi:hypothetical protein
MQSARERQCSARFHNVSLYYLELYTVTGDSARVKIFDICDLAKLQVTASYCCFTQ